MRYARWVVAATAATALAAVGGLADAATTWSADHPPYAQLSNVPYAPLAGATAVSASDAWAVGRDDGSMLAEHWNGRTWSSVDVPSAPCAVFESSCYLTSVSENASNDAIAVGNGILNASGGWEATALAFQWNGSAWQGMPLPSGLSYTALGHVKTFAANNAWAVGTGDNAAGSFATVTHWDGTAWTEQNTPFSTTLGLSMNAIAGSSPSDVWIVGQAQSSGYHNKVRHSVILHYDGTAWSQVTIPDTGGLIDVAAVSPTNAWALSWDGTVLHWDGTAWTANTSFSGGKAIAAVSANDVWVAGIYVNSALALAHYNGTTWSTQPAPAGADVISGGTALSSGAVFFAGGYYVNNASTAPAVLRTANG